MLPEDDLHIIVGQWIEKAEADFEASQVIARQKDGRLAFIIGFHCQQAVEKFIKALLTLRQTEFPKTHEIQTLLQILEQSDPSLATDLADAVWLAPFGVRFRYPEERPDTLPGDWERAMQIATLVRERILAKFNDLGYCQPPLRER